MGERVPVRPEVGDRVVDLRPEFGFRTGRVTDVIWPECVLYVQPDAEAYLQPNGVPGCAPAEFNVGFADAALMDYGPAPGLRAGRPPGGSA